MNEPRLVAVDLAKSVFQLCELDTHNNVVRDQRIRRSRLRQTLARTPSCVVAMEACYSSHYWAREFTALGHEVRLVPAQHVKPFLRGNKNDSNDALAIAEAAQRPGMRFVPVKSVEQQDMLALHRIRARLVAPRIALTNQTRGLLSEYGIVILSATDGSGRRCCGR